MKAQVYTQPNMLQLQDVPMPDSREGEVVLKIDAVGICGSDMHAWHGHDPRRKPGLVLGHEFSGTVVSSRADGVPVGSRWTGNPLITCGVCEYCVQGRNNLCANRGMVGMTRAGAYAEYMSIPAASLIAMPQDMPATTAALTEPAATAWHALYLVQRALVRPVHECRALVIGGGAIGMLAALLLRHLGAAQIVVTETNALRRQSLHKAVAGCSSLDPREQDLPESHFDCVIDAVGGKATRQQAFAAVKSGGVIMHIGLQDWSSEIDMRKLTLAEITLLGTYTYTTADLRATVDALYRGAFGDLSWVLTRPLAQAQAVFEELDQGRLSTAKVVLLP